jgi:hypothetical protein
MTKLLLIAALVSTSLISFAQEHGSSTQGSVAASEVAIRNPLNFNVSFALSCGGGDWTSFTLNSGYIERYNCPKDEEMSIGIRTPGFAPVIYKLPLQDRYVFFLRQMNQTASIVDVSRDEN